MRGFCKGHKVNQGMHIEGDNMYICDIILRGFEGLRRNRTAHLEIRGVPYLDLLRLSHSDGSIQIVDGVEIEVLGGRTKAKSNGVNISYFVKDEYTCLLRTYK